MRFLKKNHKKKNFGLLVGSMVFSSKTTVLQKSTQISGSYCDERDYWCGFSDPYRGLAIPKFWWGYLISSWRSRPISVIFRLWAPFFLSNRRFSTFPGFITHGIMVDMSPKWVSTQITHERRSKIIPTHIWPFKNLWEYAKNGQKSPLWKKVRPKKSKWTS